MCFDHIYSPTPNSSQIHLPFSTHPILGPSLFFFLSPTRPICAAHILLDVWSSAEAWLMYQGCALGEKLSFLPAANSCQQLPGWRWQCMSSFPSWAREAACGPLNWGMMWTRYVHFLTQSSSVEKGMRGKCGSWETIKESIAVIQEKALNKRTKKVRRKVFVSNSRDHVNIIMYRCMHICLIYIVFAYDILLYIVI